MATTPTSATPNSNGQMADHGGDGGGEEEQHVDTNNPDKGQKRNCKSLESKEPSSNCTTQSSIPSQSSEPMSQSPSS